MRIVTWNLGHRSDPTRLRPGFVDAALALSADVLCFTEFVAGEQRDAILARFEQQGYRHWRLTDPPPTPGNQALLVSKWPLEDTGLPLPSFDAQMPANTIIVRLPDPGITLVSLRVPYYTKKTLPLVQPAWDWIEATAAALVDSPALILGDLNCSLTSLPSRGGQHFKRICTAHWTLGRPDVLRTFLAKDGTGTWIDHALHTRSISLTRLTACAQMGEFVYAGAPNALSDHVALIADVSTPSGP